MQVPDFAPDSAVGIETENLWWGSCFTLASPPGVMAGGANYSRLIT